MSDPYWTLWATPTRPSRRAQLEEYLRLEYPAGDGEWLLAAAPARGDSTQPSPRSTRKARGALGGEAAEAARRDRGPCSTHA